MGAALAAIPSLLHGIERFLKALPRLRRHAAPLLLVDYKVLDLADNIVQVGIRKRQRVLEVGRCVTQCAKQVDPPLALLAYTQ